MPVIAQTRKQAGDTIVEVLIAVAVISAVLIGAFVVSNRSANAVQDSAEHDQANQYLQQQVEMIRAWQSVASNSDLSLQTSDFCLTATGPVAITNHSNFPAACVVGSVNYQQDINYNSATATYDCKITWSALGGGTDKVELFYKDYKVIG